MDQNQDPNAWANEPVDIPTAETTPATPPTRSRKWLAAGVAAACLISGGVGFGLGTVVDRQDHGVLGQFGDDRADGQFPPNGQMPGDMDGDFGMHDDLDQDGDFGMGGRGPGRGPGHGHMQGQDLDGDGVIDPLPTPSPTTSETPTA